MDPFTTFLSRLNRIVWTELGAVDQVNLIKDLQAQRVALQLQDVGRLEALIQRNLRITRDEWFKLLVCKDTERLRLIRAFHERNKTAKRPISSIGGPAPDVYPGSGWLGEFVYDYCKGMESPDSFLFWAGIAALSATVRRKVFVKFGHGNLYPNFYILLVSPSGKARKGPPVKSAMTMTKAVPDINYLERTTTERFPHDLSKRLVNINGQVQSVPCDAQGFICEEELMTFLDDQSFNTGIIKFLIKWWDCQDEDRTKTLKHGPVELKNIFITLLGGTTPDTLNGVLSHIMAGGGMLNRTILVSEDRTEKVYAMPDPVDEACQQRLVQQLNYINTLQGEFHFTPEALEWNEKWYSKFRQSTDSDDIIAASLQRTQAHMFKLAMLLSISDGMRSLDITPQLLDSAAKILESQQQNLPDLTRSLMATPLGKHHMRVLAQLKKSAGKLMWSDLLRANSPYGLNKGDLQAVMDTLEAAKQVEGFFDKTVGGKQGAKWYKIS